MRNFLMALAILVLAPATTFAGGNGGGGKPTSTIRVTNNGTTTLATIANRPANITNSSTPDQFRAAGGRFLNIGETASFKVKAGNNTVEAAFVSASGTLGPQSAVTVNVGKNATRHLSVTGNAGVSPVIQ